jgi:hypothetical protein
VHTSRRPRRAFVHPPLRVGDGAGGALRLVLVALLLGSAIVALRTSHAAARPLPILDPGSWACPNATLPSRIGVLQPRGPSRIDPIAWVERDEFANAQSHVWLGRSGSPIDIVVLAYLAGDPVDVEVLVAPFGALEATWRATISPDLPSFASGRVELFAHYLAVEIPREAWRTAFPASGPYTLVARPASDPTGTTLEGFCSAEARSWLFAVHP